jgi:hydroxymethylbilane synthase
MVLACAGLIRLGHAARITRALAPSESLPAIGQGALAVECRADDAAARALCAALDHAPTALAVAAERSFLARLDGGCTTPLAAHATLDGDGERLRLDGLVGAPDGSRLVRAALAGPAVDAERLGIALAEQLLAQGAAEILAHCRATGPVGGP